MSQTSETEYQLLSDPFIFAVNRSRAITHASGRKKLSRVVGIIVRFILIGWSYCKRCSWVDCVPKTIDFSFEIIIEKPLLQRDVIAL